MESLLSVPMGDLWAMTVGILWLHNGVQSVAEWAINCVWFQMLRVPWVLGMSHCRALCAHVEGCIDLLCVSCTHVGGVYMLLWAYPWHWLPCREEVRQGSHQSMWSMLLAAHNRDLPCPIWVLPWTPVPTQVLNGDLAPPNTCLWLSTDGADTPLSHKGIFQIKVIRWVH